MAENYLEAIVLKIHDVNEKESMVTFLNANGKLTLLALGLQKPTSKNKFNLQIGSIVEVEFFEARLQGKVGRLKKSNTLFSVDTTTYFNSLLVQKLVKIFDLIDGRNEILDVYKHAILKVGFGKNSYILTFFTNMLLKYFGINPNFYNCVICKNNKNLVEFEYYKGGFFCQDHAEQKNDVDLLKSFYHLAHNFDDYFDKTSPKSNRDIYLKLLSYLKDNGFFISWEKTSQIERQTK